jgi:tetratricopeptide (TPR) repeat protein
MSIGVSVLALLPSGRAAGDETPAHRLEAAGMKARDKGDHEEALRLFQQAHELEPSPMTLGLVGGEEYALRRWDEAEAHFASALNQKNNEWVGRYRQALENGLTEVSAHVGNLVLAGSPNGASVYINGRVRGALPLSNPIRVSEGLATVQVTAPGYQPFVGQTQIEGRRDTQLRVDLEKQKLVPPGRKLDRDRRAA